MFFFKLSLLSLVLFFVAPIAANADSSNKPLVYKAMETVKVPYTALCQPDPEVVQEYLLVIEIDYFTWLFNQILMDVEGKTKAEQEKAGLQNIKDLLINKKTALNDLQKRCIEDTKHSLSIK